MRSVMIPQFHADASHDGRIRFPRCVMQSDDAFTRCTKDLLMNLKCFAAKMCSVWVP